MDKKNQEKAREDSVNDKYDPPHQKPGGGWVNNYSEKEINRIEEYKETWRDNKDNMDKQKK